METVRLHTEFIGDRPPPPPEVMARVDHAIGKGARRVGDVVVAAVQLLMAPDAKTGRSLHSVTADYAQLAPGHHELGVGSSDVNVKRVTEGTGIYGPVKSIIRPLRARAMKFPHRGVRYGGQVRLEGAFGYARWIRGIQPKNYFERAYEATRVIVSAIFDETGREIASVL